ncbi:MAG: hypothetical protein HQ567_30910 [Candidatus Nealsonbacteria bacterium]|nr:hypothetical protein [Candidatus Nealsonbacteria bacterium]
MATATREEQKPIVEEPKEAEAPQPVRKRRRWRWLAATAMLLGTLWLLPGLVAHTPLLGWILARATADLNGSVRVKSASLGWLRPIEAETITVCDRQGNTVLQAQRLEGNKSLAAVLLNTATPGRFRIERPQLNVTLRDHGSNVEDLLAKYLVPDEEPSELDVSLEIVDGKVSITEKGSDRAWKIDHLDLTLDVPADGHQPLKLKATATMPDPQRPGKLAVELTMRRDASSADAPAKTSSGDADEQPSGSGELTLDAAGVSLAMVRPLLGRFFALTELDGHLTSEIHVLWGGEGAERQTTVRADATTERLALGMPQLGNDRVSLDKLEAACEITWHGDHVEIRQSELDCDLGRLSATGTVALGSLWTEQAADSLLHQTCEVRGQLDLAKLAAMLPETLRVRRDTQITDGQVQWALTSRPGADGPDPDAMVWQGNFEIGNLAAVHDGRTLQWETPIRVEFTAEETPRGPVVKRLDCNSDFLEFHVTGTLSELDGWATFNLQQLADQAGQFVDLGDIKLAGVGRLQGQWRRSAEQQFKTDAELRVFDFRLELPDRDPWLEKDLTMSLAAVGRTDFGLDTQVREASLQVRTAPFAAGGQPQWIDVRLDRPVLDFHEGGTWPVNVRMQGRLDGWPARLKTWLNLNDWQLAGAYEFDALVTGSTERIDVDEARLRVEDLQCIGPSFAVQDPKAALEFSGAWDRQRQQLRVQSAELTGTGVSLQAENVTATMSDNEPLRATGTASFAADLQRVRQWLRDGDEPAAWKLTGKLTGSAELAQSGGKTGGKVDAVIENLVVVAPSEKSKIEKFEEPKIHLTAQGIYRHDDQVLQLTDAQITSKMLTGKLAGQIPTAAGEDKTATDAQLDGEVQYNLTQLVGLFRPYLGPNVRFAGSGTCPISYRGPLSPTGGRTAAQVAWRWADVHGFRVGPGQMNLALADGVLQAEPLKLAVNEGSVSLAPKLQFSPGPAELTLTKGPLVERVQITPQMCASGLKYIAPAFAGVTTAEGSFSIDLDECKIPLAEPEKGKLAGRLTIHTVEIGPGPWIQQWAMLLQRETPAKLRRESVVDFIMIDGRVYHRGLDLIFPEMTVSTYGSVGLDQTVQVMAEMPIPPKWIGAGPLGSALKDKRIRLPIGGTLDKPKIDQKVYRQLRDKFVTETIRDTTRGVIENEVGKQLERLFGRPPQ